MSVSHLSVRYLPRQVSVLFDEPPDGVLRLPLERREGLRYEARHAHRDERSALTVSGRAVEFVDDPVREVGDAVEIGLCLGRQSVHEVELDLLLARSEGDARGTHEVLLGDVLVYDVAQPLSSRFGRESDRRRPDRRHPVHQFLREGVDAERRQRQAHALVLGPADQAVGQLA